MNTYYDNFKESTNKENYCKKASKEIKKSSPQCRVFSFINKCYKIFFTIQQCP